MPFVTSGMAVNSSRQEVAYELYIRPQYSRALRDIIVKYSWNEIWYIYNSNEGLTAQLLLSSPRVKCFDLFRHSNDDGNYFYHGYNKVSVSTYMK